MKIEMYVNLKDNPKNRAFMRKNSVKVPENSMLSKKNSVIGARKVSNSPAVGKTIKDLELNYGEKIDDSNIASVMNPTHAQFESAQYMQIKTTEKLIVNQL